MDAARKLHVCSTQISSGNPSSWALWMRPLRRPALKVTYLLGFLLLLPLVDSVWIRDMFNSKETLILSSGAPSCMRASTNKTK
jgi:hypothetical protein